MANALAVVLTLVGVVGVATAQPLGWSGASTSRGDEDIEIVRIVPG